MAKKKFKILIMYILSINLIQAQVIDYSFDYENSGVITDLSKFGNNAIVFGNQIFEADRFGNACRAFYFDGSSFLSVLNNQSINFEDEFSVAVWLKLEQDKLDWITLLCKGDYTFEGLNSPAYRVQTTNFTASFNTQTTSQIGNIDFELDNEIWFHFASTYSSTEMDIYINGKKIYNFPIYSYLGSNNANLEIGRDVPGSEEYFIGTMDELKVFDKKLNETEILQLYKKQSNLASSACPTYSYYLQNTLNENFDIDWNDFTTNEKLDTKINQFEIDWNTFLSETNLNENTTNIDWNDFELLRSIESQLIETEHINLEEVLLTNSKDSVIDNQATIYKLTDKESEKLEEANNVYKKLLVSLNIQDKFVTNLKNLSISLYDHKTIDGDIVNIYLNDSLVVSNYELKSISDKSIIQLPVSFLKAYQSNFISVEALNFGTTGAKLNTVAISIYDGKDVFFRELVIRKLNEKATLELTYKP